jgi:putative endonuclease
MNKEYLFKQIDEKIASLDEQDVTGHLYWGQFKDFAVEVYTKKGEEFFYANQLEWVPEISGFVTYVLMCEKNRVYTGYSGGFKKRMLAHFNGFGCDTTKKYRPIYIMHYEIFDTRAEAMARERQLKVYPGSEWVKDKTNPVNTIKPPTCTSSK